MQILLLPENKQNKQKVALVYLYYGSHFLYRTDHTAVLFWPENWQGSNSVRQSLFINQQKSDLCHSNWPGQCLDTPSTVNIPDMSSLLHLCTPVGPWPHLLALDHTCPDQLAATNCGTALPSVARPLTTYSKSEWLSLRHVACSSQQKPHLTYMFVDAEYQPRVIELLISTGKLPFYWWRQGYLFYGSKLAAPACPQRLTSTVYND